MTALELVYYIGVIPMSVEKPCTIPSRSEVRRWLDQKSVVINGVTATSKDEVDFPIISLVFFPNSKKRKTTVI